MLGSRSQNDPSPSLNAQPVPDILISTGVVVRLSVASGVRASWWLS